MSTTDTLMAVLEGLGRIDDRLVSRHDAPPRPETHASWPQWLDPRVRQSLVDAGIKELWSHQERAAQALHENRPTVVATQTGSGKSLGAWLDYINRSAVAGKTPKDKLSDMLAHPTAIYISPTKALARSQGLAVEQYGKAVGLRVGFADGDASREAKRWTRTQAQAVVTNPDFIHYALLPAHDRWRRVLANLSLIVIDEMHYYRGMLGAHFSHILMRLMRVAKSYGASPNVCALSATTGNPAQTLSRLAHLPQESIVCIDDDGSPKAGHTTVLWQPKHIDILGEEDIDDVMTGGAAGQDMDDALGFDDISAIIAGGNGFEPVRRHPVTEAGQVVGEMVGAGGTVLTFASSRSAAEAAADAIKKYCSHRFPNYAPAIAAYRGGYLPEERRALERQLESGAIRAMASTSALELGIDIGGLDATVTLGWPGTRASFAQQCGRAGRGGNYGISVLIAGENPLDRHMLHHPDDIFGAVESTVFDPDNPYIAADHIACAAAELPLRDSDATLFGPNFMQIVDELIGRGILAVRSTGIFIAPGTIPWPAVDIRSAGHDMSIVEVESGQVIGLVDAQRADFHPDAIYIHQGSPYKVLSIEDDAAYVVPAANTHRTKATAEKHVNIVECVKTVDYGGFAWHCGTVDVMSQVMSYGLYRFPSMQHCGEFPLDMPEHRLHTQAAWVTFSPSFLRGLGIDDIPGALHAAEHAAIGMLPLHIVCDRWDIGGLSTQLHGQTQQPTIFIYDGFRGGSGFSQGGFDRRLEWMAATAQTVESCDCEGGCPACVQSPKCGNRNEMLNKKQAGLLVEALVRAMEGGVGLSGA